MRRYLVFLLLTGTVWAQTDFDKIFLIDGTEYLGEYLLTKGETLHFKQRDESTFKKIPVTLIKSIELRNGIITEFDIIDEHSKISTVLDYENLSIEDKAKKDARRWLAYPSFAILFTGVSTLSSFYLFDAGFIDYLKPSLSKNYNKNKRDNLLNNISMLAFTSALVGSHHLFSRKDKNNIEGIIATDIELYKKMYYKQFKEQKLKNIMISIGAKALLAGAGIYLFESNFSLGSNAFGPSSNAGFH